MKKALQMLCIGLVLVALGHCTCLSQTGEPSLDNMLSSASYDIFAGNLNYVVGDANIYVDGHSLYIELINQEGYDTTGNNLKISIKKNLGDLDFNPGSYEYKFSIDPYTPPGTSLWFSATLECLGYGTGDYCNSYDKFFLGIHLDVKIGAGKPGAGSQTAWVGVGTPGQTSGTCTLSGPSSWHCYA